MSLSISTLPTNATPQTSHTCLPQHANPSSVQVEASSEPQPALQNIGSETITSQSVTRHSIPLLLEWWQQRKRLANSRSNLHATLPKGDDLYLQAYYRLMEVYSVVKSGGVQTQTEAVQAFAERESRLLHQRRANINADDKLTQFEKKQAQGKIEQEFVELKCANDWRLQALVNIAPEEEDLVQQYLPAIESSLMVQARCA